MKGKKKKRHRSHLWTTFHQPGFSQRFFITTAKRVKTRKDARRQRPRVCAQRERRNPHPRGPEERGSREPTPPRSRTALPRTPQGLSAAGSPVRLPPAPRDPWAPSGPAPWSAGDGGGRYLDRARPRSSSPPPLPPPGPARALTHRQPWPRSAEPPPRAMTSP